MEGILFLCFQQPKLFCHSIVATLCIIFFLYKNFLKKTEFYFFQENLIDVKMNDNPFLDDSGSRYFELQLNTENIYR